MLKLELNLFHSSWSARRFPIPWTITISKISVEWFYVLYKKKFANEHNSRGLNSFSNLQPRTCMFFFFLIFNQKSIQTKVRFGCQTAFGIANTGVIHTLQSVSIIYFLNENLYIIMSQTHFFRQRRLPNLYWMFSACIFIHLETCSLNDKFLAIRLTLFHKR